MARIRRGKALTNGVRGATTSGDHTASRRRAPLAGRFGRQPPALAGKPAALPARRRAEAERTDLAPIPGLEGDPQGLRRRLRLGADAGKEFGARDEAGGEGGGGTRPGHQQHGAGTPAGRQRKDQSAARRQGLVPYCEGRRGARANIDDVARRRRSLAPRAVRHGDIGTSLQVFRGRGGKFGRNLDSLDPAIRPDQMGHDRRMVPARSRYAARARPAPAPARRHRGSGHADWAGRC